MSFLNTGGNDMNYQSIVIGALAAALLPAAVLAKDKREFTDDFPLGECELKSVGKN